MKRFVEGLDRGQGTLFPEVLDDFVEGNNPVRVIEAFVGALDLGELGFGGVAPQATGRPSYHPSVLLKLYIYGHLNRVQSSRRLERDPAPLLDQRLPELRHQGSLHDGQGAPDHALGARTRPRGRPEAARREPPGHAPAPRDGRASIRHHQGADGGGIGAPRRQFARLTDQIATHNGNIRLTRTPCANQIDQTAKPTPQHRQNPKPRNHNQSAARSHTAKTRCGPCQPLYHR